MAVHAPEFPSDLEWVNTEGRVTLTELRGRVVLIEFWSSCCINCHHNLARLREVRARYGPELAILAVHSGKFSNEGSSHAIALAAERYGLHHPCLNDSKFRVWEEYCVHCWPTVVCVDPEGNIAFVSEGELDPDRVAPRLDELVARATRHDPLAWEMRANPPAGFLRYPSKVCCGAHLYVADTGHGRVLECSYGGAVLRTFSEFTEPRGLCLHEGTLYVADTGSHQVKAVDLGSGEVRVLAGNGELGVGRIHPGPTLLETRLRSPWDVLAIGKALYVAMAGCHQIWMILEERWLRVYAGNGREALVDGPLSFASFNQPSGLCPAPGGFLVADSEASAIRRIEGPSVTTLVGTGLFDFGDRDGVGKDAVLQHPLGLCEGFIADSYNHRVKTLDLDTLEVRTLLGKGQAGYRDGSFEECQLHEPEGLAVHEGRLYIADTNNHVIRVADLKSRTVTTLAFSGGGPVRVVELRLPTGWHLQRLVADGEEVTLDRVPVSARSLEVYACHDDGVCSRAEAEVAEVVEVSF